MKKLITMLIAAVGIAIGASAATTYDLSIVTTAITLASGDVITGTLGANVKILIKDGAYVILRNVTINGANDSSCKWAGLTCEGDATIYIDGENYVRGFYEDYPGIYVPEGKTLTIRQVSGTMGSYNNPLYGGTLEVPGHNFAAGIGAGYDLPCGNIVIKSGIITAEGKNAAGIGGATGKTMTGGYCGNITIEGGVVQATGGSKFAGIGGGIAGAATVVNCGDIYIGPDVTLVSAKAGSDCETPIGACTTGTVAVELAEGATDTTDDNSPPTRTIEGTAGARQYANGVAWDFRIVNGGAEICDMYYTSDGEEHYIAAIDKDTTGALVIPDTLGGRPVTRIGNSAFLFCRKITSVTIPASVTSIGERAFYYCEALTDATMPVGVTTIEVSAFEGCDVLTSVTLPEKLTSIGERAFFSCDSLTSVTIPGSVKSIGESAFEDCDVLTSVTITDGVEIIGKQAFRRCTALTGITIPASVKTVGQQAFDGCTSLATVNVSDGTTIGDGAFLDCNALADANGFMIINNVLHQYVGGDANVTVPPGITRIGGGAFMGHTSHPLIGQFPPLVSVTLPDSVTSIGSMAFAHCFELEKVVFPANMPRVETCAFMFCPKLADADGFVIIGDALDDYIGDALTLTIPPGVRSIGEWAFFTNTGTPPYYWTSPVTDVVIPSGVTNIYQEAFCYCPSLMSVSIPRSVTSIGDDAFHVKFMGSLYPLLIVHVEAGDAERVKGLLVASGHPVDDITFIEDYVPPVPDPRPDFAVLNESDITEPYAATKAVTLSGAVYDGNAVVGIVELKLGKVNLKKKTSKVSGSVTTLDGKKRTAKGVTVTGIDGTGPATVSLDVKGLGTMAVIIGGTQFAGSLGGTYHVQTADVGGAWAGGSAVAAAQAGDLAVFAGTVLSDLLPTNEVAEVSGGKWKFAKAASVKWAKPKKGAAFPEIYDAASGKGLLVDTAKGANLSGLKLNYTPKKGTFKGSFNVYALVGSGSATKLKKYKLNVSGVVVGGVGYGVATSKKPAATWPVKVVGN